MPAITATLVNDLRAKTGLPMMECKKMLVETEGDVDKAIEAFRKKGVKTSIQDRAATEGRVAVAGDGKTAVLAEVVCNTDFTAKSDTVLEILDKATAALLADPSATVKDSLSDALTAAAQKTGENVQLNRTAALTAGTGSVGSYLYSTAGKGKIGVLMQFDKAPSDDLVKVLGMHIAAARPVALTRTEVPADLVAKERDIAVEQAKQTGKPQQIAEKIAEGKLNAFYAERVLLDQEFINAEVFKGKVSEFLKKNEVKLEKYVRTEVGVA